MTRRVLAALCALMVALVAVSPAMGDVDIKGLEKELRCITCNTPLDISNAPSALDMKEYIREKAAAGWTKDQIKDALVAQFGREVLATPPKEGFDLVAWLVPAIAVAAGLAAIPFLTRVWARRGGARPAPAGADASDEERERLQRELDDLEI
ncbi:MAG: cytochrome c-type biogenesis protein CcmH [Thermoleophilia bacterium]|nr:cytochrome c-type biogenesis protein CcmH [Thermoleophilia bacterium]